MEKLIFIKNDTYFIPGVLSVPDFYEGKISALILLHGNLSCKNGDGFILSKTAERLRENGIASLRIDYWSCGESRRSRKEYNIENISKEVEVSYKYLQSLDFIDENSIGLLGHSYGGSVAYKCAYLNPKCIISFNGDMKHNYDEVYEQGKDKYLIDEDGDRYILIKQSDTRIELMYEKFFEIEHKHHQDKYSYDGNALVCVAKNDPSLNPQYGYDFYNELESDNKTLLIIEDANHTFNAKTLDYTKLNELMDKVNEWLNKNLK